jgi:hypothetical protein
MSSFGAVIIADNNEKFDYLKLAEISAGKVRKHLGIPVALITTSDYSSRLFDKIITTDHQKFKNTRYLTSGRTPWLNLNRTKVFDLSPWERTLLIDADFFIHTDALKSQINANFDFGIAKDLYNPATSYHYTLKLGKTAIDQLWATVMIFNKCDLAKNIFVLAEHVLENWEYYHKLYNFNYSPLRNDYAFTIACHLLGGYGNKDFGLKGYTLPNCDFNTFLLELHDDNVLVGFNQDNKQFIQRVRSDVHLQHKDSLFAKVSDI